MTAGHLAADYGWQLDDLFELDLVPWGSPLPTGEQAPHCTGCHRSGGIFPTSPPWMVRPTHGQRPLTSAPRASNF